MYPQRIDVPRNRLLWLAWGCIKAWFNGAYSITVTFDGKADWWA